MKTLFAVALLLCSAQVCAQRADLPHEVVLGYILYQQQVGSRSGEVRFAKRVPHVSMFKSMEACYMWTTGKMEYPDKDGFINIYFCKPLTRIVWPKGTEFL